MSRAVAPATLGAIAREGRRMFQLRASSRFVATIHRRIVSGATYGVLLLLALTLIAGCGRSTAAAPTTSGAAHGLYVTSVKQPVGGSAGSGVNTVTVTSVGLTTGKLDWHVSAPWIPFLSQRSLVVIGDFIFAPVLSIPSMTANNPTSSLIAYDRQTGRQLWSVDAGSLISAVALADGVVYVSELQQAPSHHSNQKIVTALRSSDGHTLWRVIVPEVNGFSDVITPIDGALYVVSNQICFDYCSAAYVFAMRMRDGKLLWTKTIVGNLNLATPTIDHGMLYLQVPTVDPALGSSAELDAYHTDTGALAWRFASHLSQFEFYGPPYIADGTVYTGMTTPLASDPSRPDHWTYALVALDGQTGARKWQIATDLYPAVDAANAQMLLVRDQTAIQPSGAVSVRYLSAIRRSDGKRLWRIPVAGTFVAPQFVGGAIVGVLGQETPGQPGAAVAFSLADGHTLWRTPLGVMGAQPQIVYPGVSLAVMGDVVYTSYDNATLYALRLGDGGVLWKTTLPDGITSITVV
jgi:outer membrane protein assembly factor BamB